MKNLSLIYCGILFMLVAPWCGLILGASAQLGRIQPQAAEEGGMLNPRVLPGIAAQGRQVYAELGCVACHTQQTRPEFAVFMLTRAAASGGQTLAISPDIARGWAPRGSIANDYIFQDHVLLGDRRLGPDLIDVGSRDAKTHDENWHLLHLYDPRATSPGSVMPPYRFLFETRRIGEVPSRKALHFPAGYGGAPEGSYEVVPTDRALALVTYLRNLKLDYELPDMRFPKPPETHAAAGHVPATATPAPASGTPAAPASAATH